MAIQATVAVPIETTKRRLSADSAIAIAWWTWCALLGIPFVAFIVVIWSLMDGETVVANEPLARNWFIGSMCYMAIGVPLAFFWRSRVFRGYWSGRLVAPRDYLVGMITIWAALEIGGLVSLAGCLVSGTLLPNLMPALLAFMLFTPLWPNGHSMSRPLLNEQDPGHYEDPR